MTTTLKSFLLPFLQAAASAFFFILRIHAIVNEATAYAEMALLWDAGVNGKKLC